MKNMRYFTLKIVLFYICFLQGCALSGKEQNVKKEEHSTSSTSFTQSPTESKKTPSPTPNKPVSQNKSRTEEVRAGAPLAGAYQAIEKGKRECAEALELLKRAEIGDTSLSCGDDDLRKSFLYLQRQFGSARFQFNNNTFWFITEDGKEIGPYIDNGRIKECKYGPFTAFFVRLSIDQKITYGQENMYENVDKTGDITKTEYFVNPKTWELIVHRSKKGTIEKEEYKLVQ